MQFTEVFRTWGYIANKNAPLIIHRWAGQPFYSALQGHVNVWFSGQSKDLPEATTALVWYQTYDPVYTLYSTIYLYCGFNYPALPAFEVWSISFYLMPAEASTCVPGAWI